MTDTIIVVPVTADALSHQEATSCPRPTVNRYEVHEAGLIAAALTALRQTGKSRL
jgi:hypothetical protein